MTKKDYIIKYITIILIFTLVLMLDLSTKHFLGNSEFKHIIPYLIDFETNNGNAGMAFGLLSGKIALLVVLSSLCLVLFLIIDIIKKPKSMLYNISLGFIIGGAVGNIYDRIKLGYVRDFIKFAFFKSFPTFNIADSFICIGIALLSIYLLFFYSKEKNKKD